MKRLNTFKGVVYPWYCDHMGHMNVQHYISKFDEATWNIFAHVGLTGRYMKANNTGMVAVDQRIIYKLELLPGDNIFIESEILDIENKKIHFKHFMYRLGTNEIVSETTMLGVCIDTVTRKSKALPDFVLTYYKQD